MRLSNSVRRSVCTVGFVALAILGGCNTAPSGHTGGVIDSRTRTGADRYDRAADSVSLVEFASDVGQNLAADFMSIPNIQQSQYRVILEMGSIQNMTQTPSSDFAALQRKVFLTLQQSDFVRRGAKVVERRDRMDRDAQLAGATGNVAQYTVGDTYFLQGTFSELSRGGGYQSTYLFDFTLTSAESREIVYARQFEFKQVR